MKNMPEKEIQKIVADIEGWLTDEEGEALFNLAKKCKSRGVIVEIGSWKGKSTVWLGKGSKEGNRVKIYAVDPHTGSSENQKENEKIWTFEEFKENIKNTEVDDIVVPLVKTSEEAAKNFDKPIEFIFIDGAHEYEFVKLDFDLWFPKVVNGGTIAFHDSAFDCLPGPQKFVDDMVYKSRYFRDIRTAGSITFAQKVNKNSLKDRIENICKLFYKNLYIFTIGLHLPLPKPIKIIGKKIIAGLLNH